MLSILQVAAEVGFHETGSRDNGADTRCRSANHPSTGPPGAGSVPLMCLRTERGHLVSGCADRFVRSGEGHQPNSVEGSSTTPGGSVPVAASQPKAAIQALTTLAMPSPMPAAAAYSRASGHENRGLVG
jgi:hypothetical protein